MADIATVISSFVKDSTNYVPTAPNLTAADGISEPGQFVLISATLYASGFQPLELKPVMVELVIKEDLFSFAASGHILITDSSGWIEKGNITGFNFIDIKFAKSNRSDGNVYSRTYRVFRIGPRFQLSRNNEQYALEFCSEELLLSEQSKIAFAYKEKKISNIIEDVIRRYLETNDKKINTVEETKGKYSFIVPNLKPFEAISWLSTYAQPADNRFPGADMIFYENREGYNFRSLQSMMTDRVYNTYNYSPKNLSQTSLNYDIGIMTSYKFVKVFDTLESTQNGLYANKIIALDPLLRKVDIKTFDYDNYFGKSKHLNPNRITADYVNRYGKKVNEMSDSVVKVATTNADQRSFDAIKNYRASAVAPSIGLEVYIPNRTAQLALINHTKIEFEVPGDPGLTVGSVVTLNIPATGPAPDNKQMKMDSYHSGNYLVSAVTHKMVGPNGAYECVVEAIKDSVSKPNVSLGSNTIGNKNLSED